MLPEQTVIARWMERIRTRKGWNWAQWAERAGVEATTLSRAVKENYASVTKIETLHKMARAANVPSVLDFFEGETVSVTALQAVLTEMLPLAPRRRWSPQDVEHFVAALLYALELPPADPTTPADPGAYEVAARAGAVRLRDLDGEA